MAAIDSGTFAQTRGATEGAAVQAPDHAADAVDIEGLFRTHEVGLGRFLAQMVNDRSLADELLQETFLTAVRERRRLDSVRRPEAWLFAIARNRALHALRTRARAGRAVSRLLRERARSEPDPADAVAVRDLLRRHLKPDERGLLVLRHVHGFQAEELAVMVGRTPEAVRQQLSRVRRRLLERLEAAPAEAPEEPSNKGVESHER